MAQILCIASLPLSRILAFISGGGDELHALKLLFPQNAYVLGSIIVLVFNVYMIYQLIRMCSSKKEMIQFGILLFAISITERLVLSVLNSLNQLFPSQTILGTPLLIWIWMGFISILIGIYYSYVQKKVR